MKNRAFDKSKYANWIENFLFYLLAFLGTFSIGQIVAMGLATCLLEIVIGACDTPFLYLARKLKHGDEKADVIEA